jgi:hypothetical protein
VSVLPAGFVPDRSAPQEAGTRGGAEYRRRPPRRHLDVRALARRGYAVGSAVLATVLPANDVPPRRRRSRWATRVWSCARGSRSRKPFSHPARTGAGGHSPARPCQDRHPGRSARSVSRRSRNSHAVTARTSRSSGSTASPTSAPPREPVPRGRLRARDRDGDHTTGHRHVLAQGGLDDIAVEWTAVQLGVRIGGPPRLPFSLGLLTPPVPAPRGAHLSRQDKPAI